MITEKKTLTLETSQPAFMIDYVHAIAERIRAVRIPLFLGQKKQAADKMALYARLTKVSYNWRIANPILVLKSGCKSLICIVC
jgi:hypothetical protein